MRNDDDDDSLLGHRAFNKCVFVLFQVHFTFAFLFVRFKHEANNFNFVVSNFVLFDNIAVLLGEIVHLRAPNNLIIFIMHLSLCN